MRFYSSFIVLLSKEPATTQNGQCLRRSFRWKLISLVTNIGSNLYYVKRVALCGSVLFASSFFKVDPFLFLFRVSLKGLLWLVIIIGIIVGINTTVILVTPLTERVATTSALQIKYHLLVLYFLIFLSHISFYLYEVCNEG